MLWGNFADAARRIKLTASISYAYIDIVNIVEC